MTAFAGEHPETLPLARDTDVIIARRRVRERAATLELDMVTQTKIVTRGERARAQHRDPRQGR